MTGLRGCNAGREPGTTYWATCQAADRQSCGSPMGPGEGETLPEGSRPVCAKAQPCQARQSGLQTQQQKSRQEAKGRSRRPDKPARDGPASRWPAAGGKAEARPQRKAAHAEAGQAGRPSRRKAAGGRAGKARPTASGRARQGRTQPRRRRQRTHHQPRQAARTDRGQHAPAENRSGTTTKEAATPQPQQQRQARARGTPRWVCPRRE